MFNAYFLKLIPSLRTFLKHIIFHFLPQQHFPFQMSLSLQSDISLSLTLTPSPPSSSSPSPSLPKSLNPEERGIQLIQLLLTSVNHVSSGNLRSADTCLHRISQLASVSGDSMQRLAAHFASALALRLLKRWPGLYEAKSSHSSILDLDETTCNFESFPCLGLAYAIVAQTLVQSMFEESQVHIVGLGCVDSTFWASIIQGFGRKPNRPPLLKITCVNSNKETLEKLGKTLVKEAETFEVSFQFNPLNAGLRELNKEILQVNSGEALGFISILNLHELLAEDDRVDMYFGAFSKSNAMKICKELDQFLGKIKEMSPKIMFLIEQEANHNLNRLKDRFRECLHYYSAIFDSLDVTFGGFSCDQRLVLERRFGREIENIVACDGLERKERHERYVSWMVWFNHARFRPVQLWYGIMEEAKQLMKGYGDGYEVINHEASLMICWHGRSLYAVSAWIC